MVKKNKGKVLDGKFHPHYPKSYKEQLDSLNGKEVNLMLQEPKVKTTDDQYAYYRAAIVRNACKKGSEMFGGWKEEEIHSFFCQEFLTDTKILLLDDDAMEVKITSSTSKIGKKKMSDFIQQVIVWCAEQEIVVPTPEEYYADNSEYIIDRRK